MNKVVIAQSVVIGLLVAALGYSLIWGHARRLAEKSSQKAAPLELIGNWGVETSYGENLPGHLYINRNGTAWTEGSFANNGCYYENNCIPDGQLATGSWTLGKDSTGPYIIILMPHNSPIRVGWSVSDDHNYLTLLTDDHTAWIYKRLQ